MTTIDVSSDDLDALRQLLIKIDHEHYEGMNECSICDEPLITAAIKELTTLKDILAACKSWIDWYQHRRHTPSPISISEVEIRLNTSIEDWQIRLQTEQEMHNAWRKRAEHSEKELAAKEERIKELEDTLQKIETACLKEVVRSKGEEMINKCKSYWCIENKGSSRASWWDGHGIDKASSAIHFVTDIQNAIQFNRAQDAQTIVSWVLENPYLAVTEHINLEGK